MSAEMQGLRKDRDRWASECADVVRRAMKHLLGVKCSGTSFVTPELEQILGQMTDQGKFTLSPTSEAGRWKLQREESGSVKLLGSKCMCPECVARQDTLVQEVSSPTSPVDNTRALLPYSVVLASPVAPSPARVPSSPESSTSRMARENTRHVSAQRGGHKRATDQRRLAMKRPSGQHAETQARRPTTEHASRPTDVAQTSKGSIFKIVRRKNPIDRQKAYIVMRGKFLIGVTKKQSPSYLDIVETLMEELASGRILSEQVRSRVAALQEQKQTLTCFRFLHAGPWSSPVSSS